MEANHRSARRSSRSLEASARDTKAFLRARAIENAVDLLRMILAYCLGERGLRRTAAWANAIGLVDMSNVALLYRLRQCGDWLADVQRSRSSSIFCPRHPNRSDSDLTARVTEKVVAKETAASESAFEQAAAPPSGVERRAESCSVVVRANLEKALKRASHSLGVPESAFRCDGLDR